MTISYDKRGDVLYITFEPLAPSAYIVVENENGDILKIDNQSKRVVGVAIPSFKKRYEKGNIQVPEIGAVPFNEIAEELLAH
jgi:uncharacterized protein YuzE